MNYRQAKHWLKGYCTAHHIPVDRGFRPGSNHWGRAAQATCKAAQRHARLPQTGRPDADTLAVIKPFRAKLAYRVQQEVGTKEWPPYSNSGPVLKYLAAAGLSGPSPWCAGFVTYCVKKAGWKRSLPPLLGWVPSWETWGRERGYAINRFRARKGDIVIFDWDGGAGDHIGVVTSNLGVWKGITTIEGNVSTSTALGGAVARKVRYWSSVQAILRLPDY